MTQLSMRRPSCAQCIYWTSDRTGDPPTSGHCHRYPPGIYVNAKTGAVVQKFPMIDRSQWCGEWSGDDTKLVKGATETAHQNVVEALSHPARRPHNPVQSV